MKSKRTVIAATLFTLLVTCGAVRGAPEVVTLETNIFVLKGSDAQNIEIPNAIPLNGAVGSAFRSPAVARYVPKDGDAQNFESPNAIPLNGAVGVAFRSPAVARFGSETVSLNGEQFSWSGGADPSERFDRVKTPDVVITKGTPAELRFTSPVQYMEKDSNGRLHVREIAGDSPDAPHWRLKFTLNKAGKGDGDLELSCDLDVALVRQREDLQGVKLDVGRPVMARFNDRLALKIPRGEWSAFVVRSPNGGDYTLLTLIKAVPQNSPSGVARKGGTMSAEEFAEFATYFYQHPQPELISKAIESLGPSGFLDESGKRYPYQYYQRVFICVGFFAEVFSSNPERVPDWRRVIDGNTLDSEPRLWLRQALKLSRPGALLEPESGTSDSSKWTNIYWGAFMASGNPAFLRRLVDQLKLLGEVQGFDGGAQAMLLLSFHAPHHPLVRQTLELARNETDPVTKELIETLLSKDAAAVRQLVREKAPGDEYRYSTDYMSTYPQGIPLPPTTPRFFNN